jgi:DNA (cytosine-5)-methyltransferase 1
MAIDTGRVPEAPHSLRIAVRPDLESGDRSINVIDLFSGCGGLTLGLAQAIKEAGFALDVRLAVDIDPIATAVYAANFPKAFVKTADVQAALDEYSNSVSAAGLLGSGPIDFLVGGPPCQGHSNLNNHTRRDDPKNSLYLQMARAAAIFQPAFVVVENVPAILHDHGNAVSRVKLTLTEIGYEVADEVISLEKLGVPQRRKRHILLASLTRKVNPGSLLRNLTCRVFARRDLRWAIGDLASLDDRSGIDRIPIASYDNLCRMQWLLDNEEYDLPNSLRPRCHHGEHSYRSMYGRLKWDEPAQTITSGFGSIGQGRYMHPEEARALTAHEAARIQGLPDYFDLKSAVRRSSLATMIGNAVPPQLGSELARAVLSERGVSSRTQHGVGAGTAHAVDLIRA